LFDTSKIKKLYYLTIKRAFMADSSRSSEPVTGIQSDPKEGAFE